jgi:AsmA family protein
MLEIERLEFSFRLLELLRGRVVLAEITLSRPQLLLEKNQDGEGNWKLQTETETGPAERAEFPKVEILVQRGQA